MDQKIEQPIIGEETLNKVLADPSTQEMMQNALQKAIAKSIENAFSSYSDVGRAIEKKAKEMLVPKYDMSAYAAKLDVILTQIAKSPVCNGASNAAKNFGELMTQFSSSKYNPELLSTSKYGYKLITLKELFKMYTVFIQKHIFDTNKLELNTDDGAYYSDVECFCEVEDISPNRYSHQAKRQITLSNSADEDNDEDTCFTFVVTQWDFMKDDGDRWDIIYAVEPNIQSIAKLSEFEVFLLKLMQNGIYITEINDRGFSEEVSLEQEPEATVSYE